MTNQFQDFRGLPIPHLNPVNSVIATTTTSIIRGVATISNSVNNKKSLMNYPQQFKHERSLSPPASPSPGTTPLSTSFTSSGQNNSNTQND